MAAKAETVSESLWQAVSDIIFPDIVHHMRTKMRTPLPDVLRFAAVQAFTHPEDCRIESSIKCVREALLYIEEHGELPK